MQTDAPLAEALFVGLISGTSVDAADAALVSFDPPQPELVASVSWPIPPALRARLLELAQHPDPGLLAAARADVELGETLASAVLALLGEAGVPPSAVRAIGSHGQTVRHVPDGAARFSVQIGDPNVIAQRTGITTVADFRRRDMAAGGQGAPLVPAFHAAVLRLPGRDRVVINLGGIANLTLLPGEPAHPVLGFDTGPGNALLDAWIERERGVGYDDAGGWAAEGTLDEALLGALLADPFFARPSPKSTGREYFNLAWLERHLAGRPGAGAPHVQRTLVELTARSVGAGVARHAPASAEVLLCGGGVHNRVLVRALERALAPRPVRSTAAVGIPPDWMEAMAFAWLAEARLAGRVGNLPSVTGARRGVVLGAVFSA